MLTRLYIDNFRCFVNFEFRLGQRQLLLGANGSGKSSFLDALLLIRRFVSRGETLHDLEIWQQRTRWNEHYRQSWELEAVIGGATYDYAVILDASGSPLTSRVSSEIVKLGGRSIFEFVEGDVHLFNDRFEHTLSYPFDPRRSALATITERVDNRQLTRFQQWIRSLTGFRINPFHMRSEAQGEDSDPQPDLSNIASWYRGLTQQDQRQNQALHESLRGVIESFDYLQLDQAGSSRLLTAEFLDTSGKSVRYRFDELSEGQRCLICLYAILHFLLAKGSTVIIDEPDNFVSLREIQPWLMTATDLVGQGSGQLLLVSHHPEILNQWAPEYGVRFVRDGAGPVRVQEFHGDPESPLTPAEIVARGWENE